jgi:hypothetical protein
MPTNLAQNRSRRPSPLLSSAILALASHCLAQAPVPSSEAAPYRIAGHIVSATSGQPLQRATVQILHSKTYKSEASTVSGEDGSFAFANLKPGAYVLEGQASGYITSRYDAHGGYSTAIITGAGVDTELLVLKLTPDASISGRLTDEAGDPVRHAMMTLYRESYDTGKTRTTRVGSAQTDATGAYDIAHLAPGKYFLSATATPWYAVHPQPAMQAGIPRNTPANFQYLMPGIQSAVGVVDAVDPSLDVAYPMTFYADATDSSAATPIILKGGDQPELDLRLTPQTAVTITIPFAQEEDTLDPGRTPESQAAYRRAIANRPQFQLQRQVFDSLEPVNTEMRGTSTEYTYIGIPPGQYVLRQMNSQNGAGLKSTTINLTDRSTQIDPARGENLGSIKVLLKTADGAKLPPQSSFELIPEHGEQVGGSAVNDKGEAEIKGLEPGAYSFRVFLGNKEYFVTHLTSDGKILPGSHLQITTAATQSITVTAGPATATLQGFAKTNEKPAPGAMVLLLPADQANRTGDVWKDQSDLDGSFTLSNIPPGRYILLAIQNGWDLEWQREDVLAHYLPLGVPITIPTTSNAALKLPDPLPVQPR